jgi:hypothetical protein
MELLEADHFAVRGVVHGAVALDREAGDVREIAAALERLAHVEERELALAETDRVGDAAVQVHLGSDAREPAAPDDRQLRMALAHRLRDDVAVVDLVAEDARAREEQRAFARLEHLRDVVRLDHRVDHHDLVAIRRGTGGDLQELQRQQICAEDLAALGVGAMREEQDELGFALDHDVIPNARRRPGRAE